MSTPLSPLTTSLQNSRALSLGLDEAGAEKAEINEDAMARHEPENLLQSRKRSIEPADIDTPSSLRYESVQSPQGPDPETEEIESIRYMPSSPFQFDGRDDTVDFQMLRNRQTSVGQTEHSLTPKKRSFDDCPEDMDSTEYSDDRSKKGMSRKDIDGIPVYTDEEYHSSEENRTEEHVPEAEATDNSMEDDQHEGMSTVFDGHDDKNEVLDDKENFESNLVDDVADDDSHDFMDDTCLSTFSAVPNADMTSFAKLRGDSPFKTVQPPSSSPEKMDELQSQSPGSGTPRASRKPQNSLLEIGTPISSRSPKRSTVEDGQKSSGTPNLLDLTEHVPYFPRQRYSVQKERYSPSRRSPLRNLRETIRSPSKASLLDFDIPAIPTPRSIPTVTPRELESLKSGFLSEISSLKATLSGKEAEVASLKQAVTDAERRVGEALDEVQNEAARKEALEIEQAEWQRRGQEMEDILRSVRAEIVEGEREKEQLAMKVKESEKNREQLERRMVEVQSQLSAARASTTNEAGESTGGQRGPTAEEAAREVQDAVEKVARELHGLYKSKHETKVAALKKSYEARWEKRVREAEDKWKAVSEDNERLQNERDAALSGSHRQDTNMMDHQNDEYEAEKRVLEAQIQGLQQEMTALKRDSVQLRAELEVERTEKGELVAAVDEWLAIQQNPSQSPSASHSPTKPEEYETPEPQPTPTESNEDLRRSVNRSGSSGIRPPSTGSGSGGERKISKIGAPTPRNGRGNSGGKSGIAVFTPGRPTGGILGSIERMGRGGV